jgi:TolB protein
LRALLLALLLGTLAGGPFESNQDIGITPKPGTAEYNTATRVYQVTGGGANIWAKQDAFQFVYQKVSGDVTLTADVHFLGKGVEPHRKLALMIRQSLAPDSAYADVAVHGDGSTSLQYRPSAGVDTSEFRAAMKSPTHLSITRHGHEFSISASDVGVSPATTGPVIVSMQNPVYVGLAVCSHNADVLETATFSNVRLVAK